MRVPTWQEENLQNPKFIGRVARLSDLRVREAARIAMGLPLGSWEIVCPLLTAVWWLRSRLL